LTPSTEPTVRLFMAVGADELHGVKDDGVWFFRSTVDFIAGKWSGDTVTTNAVEDFTKAALARFAELRALELAAVEPAPKNRGAKKGGAA
jgi:hypothetical protein